MNKHHELTAAMVQNVLSELSQAALLISAVPKAKLDAKASTQDGRAEMQDLADSYGVWLQIMARSVRDVGNARSALEKALRRTRGSTRA